MTTVTATPAPAKPARKGSKIMWAIVALLAIVAVAGWIAVFVGFQMDFDKPTMIGILTVTALSMEGLFWTIAAAVGVSVFEARKRIWRFLTGRGWTMP